ncbi:MEDS domain-containing protein [Pseudonocardia sp.]|uniref:MEDS domain-containing protein n=1 Tax=Pseudonocardia sp. TaxID=60912 RepID=UPI003D10EE49
MTISGTRTPVAERPRHSCAFPVSDEQLWEMTAAWIADGLSSGERVTYFEDGTAGAVLDRLADDGVCVDDVLDEGRLEVVGSARTRAMLEGSLKDVREVVRARIAAAVAAGHAGWRTTGQLSHALSVGRSLPDFDAALDDALLGQPARALCLYDRYRHPEDVVVALRAVHPYEVRIGAVYDDGLLRVTRVGLGRLRFAGEADHSNHGTIDRLLHTAFDEVLRASGGPDEIVADLSSLRFLDVAGAASLVGIADRLPGTHRLVLHGVRPPLQRVLDRCGAPFSPRLDVVPRERPRSERRRAGTGEERVREGERA